MIPFTADAVRERAKRLELALAHADMNATSLARRLGVTSAALSDIKHGKSKAPERWTQAAEILDVPPDWLILGRGPAPSWALPSKPAPAVEPVSQADQVAVLRAELAAMAEQMRAAFASFAAQLAALQAATGRPLSAPPSPYPYSDNPLLRRESEVAPAPEAELEGLELPVESK